MINMYKNMMGRTGKIFKTEIIQKNFKTSYVVAERKGMLVSVIKQENIT